MAFSSLWRLLLQIYQDHPLLSMFKQDISELVDLKFHGFKNSLDLNFNMYENETMLMTQRITDLVKDYPVTN